MDHSRLVRMRTLNNTRMPYLKKKTLIFSGTLLFTGAKFSLIEEKNSHCQMHMKLNTACSIKELRPCTEMHVRSLSLLHLLSKHSDYNL